MSREAGVGSGGPPPLVLILSPTRELALQIAIEARQLCTFHKLGVVTLVGGTSVDADRRALNRPSGGDFPSSIFPRFLLILLLYIHTVPYHILQHTILLPPPSHVLHTTGRNLPTHSFPSLPYLPYSLHRCGHLGGFSWSHARPFKRDARFRQTMLRRQGR